MTVLSIAMATYNGGPYIRAQLDSLARQTRLPDELIITDDCSSDTTVEEIRRFAKDAPFPVHLHENSENLGYARNFAKALGLTTGDIVFPCDQDDAWMPEKIATMLAHFGDRPETALILCDTLLCDAELNPNGQTKLGQIRANGLPDTAHVMGCCIALRRELLDLALPQPKEAVSHDNWLTQIADELGISVRLDTALQYYRLHGSNTSDFFINTVHKQTTFDRLRTRLHGFLRHLITPGGLAAERIAIGLVLDRMETHPDGFSRLAGEQAHARTIQRLRRKHEFLGRRLAIRSSQRLRRPAAILSLWAKGGYAGSGGLTRALKDFVISGA